MNTHKHTCAHRESSTSASSSNRHDRASLSEAAAAAEIEQLHKDKAELAEQVEALKAAAAERAGEVRLLGSVLCMLLSCVRGVSVLMYTRGALVTGAACCACAYY